jgi:hypothetical protein
MHQDFLQWHLNSEFLRRYKFSELRSITPIYVNVTQYLYLWIARVIRVSAGVELWTEDSWFHTFTLEIYLLITKVMESNYPSVRLNKLLGRLIL